MKRIVFAILLLLVSQPSFCQQFYLCDVSFNEIAIRDQFPGGNAYPYSTLISTGDANNMITAYDQGPGQMPSKPTIQNIKYFLFDAGTLLTYIYQYMKQFPNTQNINFVFGLKDGNIQILVLGDDGARYQYLSNGVLAACLTCNQASVSAPDNLCNAKWDLSVPNMATLGAGITWSNYYGAGLKFCGKIKYFPRTIRPPYSNYISTADADAMITNYITQLVIDPNEAFAFDAGTLAYYLYNTNGIQDVQLILARNNMDEMPAEASNLTLLVAGVDKNGNHVYFNDGYKYGVLEHCYPCPTECMSVELNMPDLNRR